MQSPEEYEITERVNALVKGLKKRRGYTKKDISQKLGIGLTTFNDYLNGVSSFKLGTLIKFAALCKLTLPDILDDTQEAKKLYSEDLADRANAGKNTLDFLVFVILIPTVLGAFTIQWVFLAILILLLFYARKDLNSQSLSLVYIVVMVPFYLMFIPIEEYIYPNYSGFIQNIAAFSLAISSDLCLLYLLKNKMQLGIRLRKSNFSVLLEKNYIEGPLYGVTVGLLCVDLLAFLENIIRHLDKLGISKEFAKQFWKVRFIYDHFEYFKIFLMALILVLLFVGTRIRQRQHRLAMGESRLGMNT
ncbi:helix-turn-helix domain-containing protein [Pseudoalteromonas xiamenensis]|uniref:Helix-turn-helix transcriptional regulator n=1 Tax=Pseudoalteromonas xiamenensis TaxID=882626 RepID=A0A975DIY5_9GAMM|nr:helix-turn-helix transcriptional regulator [Pseudoalteromonas xiamenensis]QTH72718.1 helix-turn-helix transcriptional regulator [Pseudoalteromonas xiamenensis]